MQEVEPITGQFGRTATSSGQNVLETRKFTSSVSRKPSEIEPWLPLNVNRKSYAVYLLAIVGIT